MGSQPFMLRQTMLISFLKTCPQYLSSTLASCDDNCCFCVHSYNHKPRGWWMAVNMTAALFVMEKWRKFHNTLRAVHCPWQKRSSVKLRRCSIAPAVMFSVLQSLLLKCHVWNLALLKIKVLRCHRRTFLSKCSKKEPLTSEEPFCFTKVAKRFVGL